MRIVLHHFNSVGLWTSKISSMPQRTQIVLSLILLKLWHNDADSYPVGGGGRWAWQVGVAFVFKNQFSTQRTPTL